MEAIIFDVDGTLWDSTDEVAVSWNEALKRETELRRKVTAEELKKEFGKPLEEIMAETAPCKVYAGVPEVIRELAKRYKVCIVSNCQEGYIEAFLKNTGLGDAITDHTCPGDTGKLKAENIRLIMERNGIREAIYVGDTQGDADACRKADIPMICAEYGFGEVEGDYKRIKTFYELLELV